MEGTDLISRQDAIDALDKRFDDIPMELTTEILLLRNDLRERLQPAEPKIIHCKDCKWFGKPGCAISIVDDTDKPKETDFCSFAERAEE